jgi:Chaperone of endosialidase
MSDNSFSLFVRRPPWGSWILAFRLFCVAAVVVSLFSGQALAQEVPATNVTGAGTADFIPRWTGPHSIGNSLIFQTVGGQVGIGTTGPSAKLDVKGSFTIHGTSFSIDPTGTVHFVSGQTFPGTGTVTSVATGLGLKGGPITTTGTLTIDTSVVPQLGTANTFTGNQSVTGNVTASGEVQGTVVNATTSLDIGGSPFAFQVGSNVFFGFAGNTTMTGTFNTGGGAVALLANTTGSGNAAYAEAALVDNTTGTDNAAFGTNALFHNTTGSFNTAIGVDALESNTTGSNLTCVGFGCTMAGKNLHNATAIGARATVKVSNALVLGSVAGVNGATATTMVGIGTNSPTNLLTLGQGFGPSIGDGWATYSSRRWKTNIQPIHNALGMVERLKGVSYDLKDSGKHEIGVIAEEVGTVVPEVVSYEENGKDARGVDYSRLTALLIEATKQQQREIRQQQEILRTQAAAIRDLKSELRTTRQTLQKVQAQVAATQPALVAAK